MSDETHERGMEVRRQVLGDEPIPPSRLRSEVPAGLESRGAHSTRTAGSFTALRSDPMMASRSSSGSVRTSTVAFTSEGITLMR